MLFAPGVNRGEEVRKLFSLFLVKWFKSNGGFWGVVYVYWVGGESDIGGDRVMIGGEIVGVDVGFQRLE